MIQTGIISDSVLIAMFIGHAFLLNANMSFTIQPIPYLNPSRFIARDNDIESSFESHEQSQKSFYRNMNMKGDDVWESDLPNKPDNRTRIDAPLFFADEDCHDLCELAEDELEDNFFSSAQIHSKNHHGVFADSDSPSPPPYKSVEKTMTNIELRWNIDKSEDECNPEDASTCSDVCDACEGKGVVDCHFCNGTGWIDFGEQIPGTVGEKLVERNDGVQGTECPVCNDDCEQTCQKCMGSGWIARWRLKKNLSNDLKP